MASINIGSLKFNWKGNYNGSTAYAVDDVTEYNGSSYICILASTGNLPTNTTYFQPMATKGTDGTDVSTTLTTQGDILYRDGSGLQRLEQETRPIREEAKQVTAPSTEQITEEVQNLRPQASTLNLPDTGNFAPLANQQPRPVAPGMGTGEQLLAAIEREKALGLRSS